MVGTHWMAEIEVCRSRPRVGNATLTIVASRIVMMAPSTTTTAGARISRVKTPAAGAALAVVAVAGA
jgi:hypothetical protein